MPQQLPVTPALKKIMLGLALGSLIASPAAALDTFMVGPRALGMGGANVASTNDTSAQYYNPAALGFFGRKDSDGKKLTNDNNGIGQKAWGMDLGAGAGARLHGEMGTFLEDLADIDPESLNDSGLSGKSDIAELLTLLKNLDGLDKAGNAFSINANGGLGVRVGGFAVGARGFAQGSGRFSEVDQANLGFSVDANTLTTNVNNIGEITTDATFATFNTDDVFTLSQQTGLVNALTSKGVSSDSANETVKRLAFVAAEQGLTTAQIAEATDFLETSIDLSGPAGNSLDNNLTTVAIQGFAIAEVPLSYGRAINDNWAVGANLKLMRGRVYGTQVLIFDNDADDIVAESDEDFEETTTFGIDLGVMGRYRMVNLGLIARNINAPKFDGFTKDKVFSTKTLTINAPSVTLDPQVTAGVAFIPVETLTLETNLDLTKNETAFTGYDTQNLSFGLEWDAFRALALRAGAYKNLAEDDIGWVYTAGLGLNLWAIRLDLAGAMANDTVTIDGDKVPKEAQAYAQLSIDF